MPRRGLTFLVFASWVAALTAPPSASAQTVALGGVTVSQSGLVGVGRIPANQRDSTGETFGSLSGLALDLRTWRRNANGSYSGTLYSQPDRGIIRAGAATNYQPRIHRLTVSLLPAPNGASSQSQLTLSLAATTLLRESGGTPLTSLDPSPTVSGVRTGFPALPQAFNGRISLDAEGLVLLPDGTFFICDEYGPYLYRFSAAGVLLGAIRPPEAFIPKRGGRDSFSSDNPASGQPSPSPSEPTTGRENNQGFEGLATSADGRSLYVMMQSALRQDGGAGGNSLRRHTRLLAYDITNPAAAILRGEWVLPLPVYTQNGAQQVASVGDIVALSSRQFLVLVRDGNGRGSANAASVYRAVLLYDVSGATNIAGSSFDTAGTPVAPNGVLAAAVTPATSAVFLNLNDASQLAKFGLNNSAADNSNTLAEKWESLALAPAYDPAAPDDFFLLIGNDNDFTTTDGFLDGSSFRASLNVDTMVLVYRLTLGTRLINISSRSLTGAGADAHIVGFVVQGARARNFVIRGVGPGLAAFGVPGTLPDPVLQIFDKDSRLVLANDNWNDDALAADLRTASAGVGAFALPENSRDAALLVTLDPGAYTVQIADAAGRSGVSLAEVYEVP
jgi:hypothetical protein